MDTHTIKKFNLRKIMKLSTKLVLILLAIVVWLNGAQGSEPERISVLAAHFSLKYREDLDGLLKRRYIRVLTTLNKTNFFISEGKFFGFEYSLLKEYEKFLNKDIRKRELRLVLEFIPVTRDKLIPGLIEGYGDIAAAGLTITPERSRLVDFTEPYLTGINEIVVTHMTAPELKSVENLSGKRVFVRKSSSYYESLVGLNRKLRKARKTSVKIVLADENLETEDILELVNSGAIKITVSDSHIANIWKKIFKNIRVYEDLRLRSGSRIAWMVRKDCPLLKRSLNNFLKRYKKGTLLGNIFFNRYYKKNVWISNPLKDKKTKQIRYYEKLFKKYASMYGFDWVVIKAMAYQESGLDQNKRNPSSGAVGIMQIRPETAADKNVGIKDVTTVENNIHAAVKYLAFLRQRYFNSPDIRPRDRVRFALAAYNAGPAKVRRARDLAKSMGLSPNRWFRNVEVAALEIMGQETVRYVSNINKYAIIYKLALVQEKARSKEKEQLENRG